MCLCAIDISVRCEKTHAEMEMRMGRLEEQEIKEMREEQREPQIYTLEDWDSPEQSRRRSRGEQGRSTRNRGTGRAEQSRSTRNSRAARNYRNPEWDEERTGSRRRKENYSEDWGGEAPKPQGSKKGCEAGTEAGKAPAEKEKGNKASGNSSFSHSITGGGLVQSGRSVV